MRAADARFWMAGKSATNLLELSTDPASLSDGGFWAVSVTYEGEWRCAKFENVVDEPFQTDSSWHESDDRWESTFSRKGYIDYVERIRSAIVDGDIYQANACRIYSRKNLESLEGLFAKMLASNPAPYSSYLRIPGVEIASASPELFLEMSSHHGKRRVKTSPVKGTSATENFPEKDRSENIMIVDLMRNDLSTLCEIGSVSTLRLLAVEPHPGLFHLVSDVLGELRSDVGWAEIADHLLPAGSISGAPKSSATALIEANESPRGPYCGLIGWVQGEQAVLAVAIRTFWQSEGTLNFGSGAGITWSSDAQAEWDETVLKASRLLKIAGGRFDQ